MTGRESAVKTARRAALQLLRAAAVLYPVVLLAVLAAFHAIGERWPVTTVLLYLPRLGFALPLPILLLGVWVCGPRWLLAFELVALGLVLFPLMGFHVSHPRDRGALSLRVFSCNIYQGTFGLERIVSQIRALDPDVALLQEGEGTLEYFRTHLSGYDVRGSAQFVLATRYPVLGEYAPGKVLASGVLRSARFMGYTLATPLGNVDFYDVHPISPREGLTAVRGVGLRHEIASGRVFRMGWATKVGENAELRRQQIAAFVERARQSRGPVIIAGDTNLPEGSFFLSHFLGAYRDGFREAGNGFGYTFPADKKVGPWMRIDRVLASPDLEFSAFHTVRERVSDHLCVTADLSRKGAEAP